MTADRRMIPPEAVAARKRYHACQVRRDWTGAAAAIRAAATCERTAAKRYRRMAGVGEIWPAALRAAEDAEHRASWDEDAARACDRMAKDA